MPFNFDDFRFRYTNSFIGLDKAGWNFTHPFYIVDVAPIDGAVVLSGKEVQTKDAVVDKVYSFPILKDGSLGSGEVSSNFDCPPLGMCDVGDLSIYVSRVPARQYKKGLRADSLMKTLVPSFNVLRAIDSLPDMREIGDEDVLPDRPRRAPRPFEVNFEPRPRRNNRAAMPLSKELLWGVFNADKIRTTSRNAVASLMSGKSLAKSLSRHFAMSLDPSHPRPVLWYKQLIVGEYLPDVETVVLRRPAGMLLEAFIEQCPDLPVAVE